MNGCVFRALLAWLSSACVIPVGVQCVMYVCVVMCWVCSAIVGAQTVWIGDSPNYGTGGDYWRSSPPASAMQDTSGAVGSLSVGYRCFCCLSAVSPVLTPAVLPPKFCMIDIVGIWVTDCDKWIIVQREPKVNCSFELSSSPVCGCHPLLEVAIAV